MGFQNFAFGLAKSSAEGKLNPSNFVSFLNALLVCIETLFQALTPDQHKLAFTLMYKPVVISGIQVIPAIYFVGLLYALCLMGGIMFFCVNILGYYQTAIKLRRFEKNQQQKVEFLFNTAALLTNNS